MTMLIFSLVIASMLSFFGAIQRTAAREASRSQTTDAVRVVMDRITKDVRQAITVRAGAGPSFLDLDTFIDGVQHRVTFDTDGGSTLRRTVDNGTPVEILERVQDLNIFTYSPDATDPSVLTVTLVARAETFSKDMSDVTLTSEVKLRNR